MRTSRITRAAAYAFLSFSLTATRGLAQESVATSREPESSVDSLVARALLVSPQLRAARLRIDAARARVSPAGARPDPMLMAGIENLPLGTEEMATSAQNGGSSSGPDPMTMKVIGLSQTIPYPGKLGLRQAVAERDVDATRAAEATLRSDVTRRVREAYYEIAFLDEALAIAERRRAVLSDLVRLTEVRYSAGTGAQQDVLKSRVEATRLTDESNALVEQRRAELATLNTLLDRPADTPIGRASIPTRIASAAVADSAARIRFTSDAVSARVANSPLPSLESLQSRATATNPMLKEHEAKIATQTARVAVAEKERRPDFDIALQYGQRSGRPDMVTATISVPLPVQRGRKQEQSVAEARAELAALEAEHHAQLNDLRAEIARLDVDLERSRTQLALYVKAILPQGRAVLASATADYQSGRGELRAVLDSQSTLFEYETTYYRTLADFAKQLAGLEQVVGAQVLP